MTDQNERHFLSTAMNLSIRHKSIELDIERRDPQALITFELFSYRERSADSKIVAILSQTVPFSSTDPTGSTRHPDFERMTQEAAGKLAADFERVLRVIREMANPQDSN